MNTPTVYDAYQEVRALVAWEDFIAFGGEAGDVTILAKHAVDTPEGIQYDKLQSHLLGGGGITALAWAASTSLSIDGELSPVIAAASEDFNIRLIESNDVHSFPPSHTTYINDLAFSQTPGYANILASVGDDRKLLVWRYEMPKKEEVIELEDDEDLASTSLLSTQIVAQVVTSSPGICVRFHKSDVNHIMVAEQKGVLRLFNWDRGDALWQFSLYGPSIEPDLVSPFATLTSADWMSADARRFGAIIGSKWYLWNLETSSGGMPSASGDILDFSMPHVPSRSSVLRSVFRFHPTNSKLFVIGSPGSKPLHVYQAAFPQVPSQITMPPYAKGPIKDITWVDNLNIIACASGQKIVITAI